MKAIQMRCGDKLDEISVAGLILGQQSDVICRVAPRCRPILVRPGSNVGFATNDRFHPGVMCFLVKFNRPKQIAVIRDRYGRHFEFSGLFHQLFHPDTSIQQRIFSMQMKVNESVSSHQLSSISLKKKVWQIFPALQRELNEERRKIYAFPRGLRLSPCARGEDQGEGFVSTTHSSSERTLTLPRLRSECRLPGSVLRST